MIKRAIGVAAVLAAGICAVAYCASNGIIDDLLYRLR